MSRIDRVLELALGLAFLAAGMLKVLEPAEFALSLAKLSLLPSFLLGAAAILLPWVEIVSGLALVATRRYRDAATWLNLGLLAVFTTALVAGMVRGSAGTCGCFGSGIAFLNRPEVGLARNLLLIAAAAALVARRRKPPTSRSGPASTA
ncbi:MAG TPA: MauE/DoxX family redox-associated membrane protein [Planctomycetota bacterium]|nr:MauE/DoxX family redox-associated membrane protein [Planctomycetota bacterium]